MHHNIKELTGCYRRWSQEQAKAETTVALFYVSDYGYSDRLSQAIAQGITKTGVVVEMVDLKATDNYEVKELVGIASGIVIGTPPAHSSAQLKAAVSTI